MTKINDRLRQALGKIAVKHSETWFTYDDLIDELKGVTKSDISHIRLALLLHSFNIERRRTYVHRRQITEVRFK